LKTLADIERAMAPLDAAIGPIAKSGIDLSRPGWVEKLRALKPLPEPWQPALDRAGVREEADTLVAEIIDRYAAGSGAEREAIRALFSKFDSFGWAVTLPHEPMNSELLRKTLLLFSIKDQEKDWRDAIVWLDGICARAAAAGLPLAKMLAEAAALSSDVPPFGQRRSTRKMLADYAERFET
jgi:hypothetical protein